MGRKLLDAETWFERASFFHLAALELLVTRHGNNKALAYPAITLKAFATEAYFKSLIALEESARPADIHDLVILFGRLSSASRKSIRAQWDRETRPILLKARQNPPPGITVPTTLQKALEQSRHAFLEWRYHPKGEALGFSIGALPSFVRRRILELRPDWTPQAPNVLCQLDADFEMSVAARQHASNIKVVRPVRRPSRVEFRRAPGPND